MGRQPLVARLLLLAGLACAAAAHGEPPYRPRVGQAGKDVIWVPTPPRLVEQMLRRVELGPQDVLVDLGSGDGRIVIAAAKSGARALGIEYDADMVAFSRRNAKEGGVADRARFVHGDLFETDFGDASVVSMYLLPQLLQRLRPRLLDMKPGTRIVSYEFNMAEWAPDEILEFYGSHNLYFWVVPAKVDGVWKLRAGDLSYRAPRSTSGFQTISGSAELGTMKVSLREAAAARRAHLVHAGRRSGRAARVFRSGSGRRMSG